MTALRVQRGALDNSTSLLPDPQASRREKGLQAALAAGGNRGDGTRLQLVQLGRRHKLAFTATHRVTGACRRCAPCVLIVDFSGR